MTPVYNQLNNVLKFAFGQKIFANNDDFKNIISQLCLADLFLIEHCQNTKHWQESIKIYDANKCVYACNICNAICFNVEELIDHLKTTTHQTNVLGIDSAIQYYHPVFFPNHNRAQPEPTDEISRVKFLYALVAAKIVENEMIAKRIPPLKSSISFSGKKIVVNATKDEFDEVAKKFVSDKLRNLEEAKMEYNTILSRLEETGDKYNEAFKRYKQNTEGI